MTVATLTGIVTLVRAVQLKKAYFPRLVTPLGIVTAVRPVPLNTERPISAKPPPIVAEVMAAHPPKAELPRLVTLLGIVTAVSLVQP